MTDKNQSYLVRLKICYNALSNSRVVKRRETDTEALNYFEKFCNESLPESSTEEELRNCIKNLYKCNPTSFVECAANDPYLFLLTEARAIVQHFGVREIIYIRWNMENRCYMVEKNTKSLTPNRFQKKIVKHKYDKKKEKPFYKYEKREDQSHEDDGDDANKGEIGVDNDGKVEKNETGSWADRS